jgi:hypothetical protein
MSLQEAGIAHHLDSAVEADAFLRRAAPVSQVGYAGARFGGAIAALAGQMASCAGLILWDPVVHGASFLRSLLRQEIASRVTSGDGASGESRDSLAELAEKGILDLQGIAITRRLFDEISVIDLVRDLAQAPMRTLIVQVSPSRTPKHDFERLRSRLVELHGECSLEFARTRDAVRFGGPKFKPIGDGRKLDLQAEIGEALAQVTSNWVGSDRREGRVVS